MADQVGVDPGGLSSGAAHSAAIAAGLANSAVVSGWDSGDQPSSVGVSAVAAAISSVRGRQAARVVMHANSMRDGAYLYADTDTQSARNLAETV